MSRSIIKKAAGIGSFTLISRFFAYIREILMIQFFGIGAVSDAFLIALRIPNSLRKIFAEGALSSVLVPALVHAERKDGHQGVNRLLTLSFFAIESLVAMLVAFIYWQADTVAAFSAPHASPEMLQMSAGYIRILVPFLLFLSSSSIFAAAMQASHRFLIPAIAPAFLNFLYIAGLACAIYFSWSVSTFCWSMIVASVINLVLHGIACWYYAFRFQAPIRSDLQALKLIILQLAPSMVSVGIAEINMLIDSRFASSLHAGSLSLLRYAFQFINIPLGVIAASLSMVLLPHFSKIGHSKKELGEYLTQAIIFVSWVMLPVTILMICCSQEIFQTMFFSAKFTTEHVVQAGGNLNGYAIGLVFYSLEKILLNAFYALHASGIATIISVVTIFLNYCMNHALMSIYGGMGLALATSLSAGVRIVIFVWVLISYFKIDINAQELLTTARNYLLQLVVLSTCFIFSMQAISVFIASFVSEQIVNLWVVSFVLNSHFFLQSFGFWLWFGPLAVAYCGAIYLTKNFFGVKISYLE